MKRMHEMKITYTYPPWYKRLWYWITRRKFTAGTSEYDFGPWGKRK